MSPTELKGYEILVRENYDYYPAYLSAKRHNKSHVVRLPNSIPIAESDLEIMSKSSHGEKYSARVRVKRGIKEAIQRLEKKLKKKRDGYMKMTGEPAFIVLEKEDVYFKKRLGRAACEAKYQIAEFRIPRWIT